ncbi:hypothetical protein [Paenibacillus apis]|uniref:Uncharacterized protein n=1 Tax=Paenibacillus apis TaxID=1792174 RepID=A0A920CK81_9BACL|nr:hypothetical protein [Paenibacillus apis]GIO42280.1 hypothetical protein J41TS4_20380 [Paenibacillus apis]
MLPSNSNLPISNNLIQTDVGNFAQGLTRYLDELGLPSAQVLVDPSESLRVITNLPYVVDKLSEEKRGNSMYISKFVAACGAGLFDAALNMLWNETVNNLREKVTRFDMDYFLDSVITDTRRRVIFKSVEDLNKLEEWELVKGCKDTGIITEIGYKHLDYIRDMRNHASAAHPNHNDLTGLQLVGWLETCIIEVLGKEPEGPVIHVKQLLHNLRTKVLSNDDVAPINANIQQLPIELINSTLRAVFGMFTSHELAVHVRNNLKLISKSLWDKSSKQVKHETGIKYATFSANAELDRKQFAHDFLTNVNGLSFIPSDLKAIDMDQVLDTLTNAHYGWNNFHNEPPHARLLASYIPDTGEIPESVSEKYVKTVIDCSIGNAYGISTAANSYYRFMLERFTEDQQKQFILLLWDDDICYKLSKKECLNNFKSIASEFSDKATNPLLKKVLSMIVNPKGTIIEGAPLSQVKSVTKFYEEVERLLNS